MKKTYNLKIIELINNILVNTQYINSIQNSLFFDPMENNTIVEVGSSAAEKLFLLDNLIKHYVSQYDLHGYTGWSMSNSNTAAVLSAVERILSEEEQAIYTVVLKDIPVISFPVEEIFEAKNLAKGLRYKASVKYNGVVLYKNYGNVKVEFET